MSCFQPAISAVPSFHLRIGSCCEVLVANRAAFANAFAWASLSSWMSERVFLLNGLPLAWEESPDFLEVGDCVSFAVLLS